MSGPFDYFVVFAEMRTGSNLLETNLNTFPGLHCYGEAFNPSFIGYPKKTEILGLTQEQREADPIQLISAIRERTEGLGGFRFFHDHDSRAFKHCLADTRCAKIILTRNPIDSYVSLKIVRKTGQWKLSNVKNLKSAKIRFDAEEFDDYLEQQRKFQLEILEGLQRTGQTAFYIAYEDLMNADVLNGLAQYLGQKDQLEAISRALKKQNPAALEDKVLNFEEMERALARVDHFSLNRVPNFEPRRGPAVPTYVAAAQSSVLYAPVNVCIEDRLNNWLAALDGIDGQRLLNGFTQKTLRQWKRRHEKHRSFTVVMHPVQRIHSVFCSYVLNTAEGRFGDIRETLRKGFKLPIPASAPGKSYDRRHHRNAFLAFLAFLKRNLASQTSMGVNSVWASQAQILNGISQFSSLDMVLREEQLELGLRQLAEQVGISSPPVPEVVPDNPYILPEIYDEEIEAAVRAAYQRDYMMFGYKAWG